MDRWGEKSNLDGPLEFGGKVIGVLGIVESRYCRRFTEDEKRLFSQLAVLAAIAIHNADIFASLEHLAITDGLTGLYNHRYFYERLAQEVARADRYELPLSLLIIDIDDFKALQRPVRASRRRRGAARRGACCSRPRRGRTSTSWRATEARSSPSSCRAPAREAPRRSVSACAALSPGACGRPATGVQPGERGEFIDGDSGSRPDRGRAHPQLGRRRGLRPPGSPANITVSVGVASFRVHALSIDGLVEAADRAVYRAKELGKNRVEMAPELVAE